jgi:hypothetical protein
VAIRKLIIAMRHVKRGMEIHCKYTYVYQDIYGFILYETFFGVMIIRRCITLDVEKTLISIPGIIDFLSYLYIGVGQMKLLVFTFRQMLSMWL